MSGVKSTAAWHCALCYAITGVRFDDLGAQSGPDPDFVADVVAARVPGGAETIMADVGRRRAAGQSWPYPLPEDLAAGLGPAQWSAALDALRRRMGIDRPVHRVVRRPQPPDRDDLRLLQQLPPHHGQV
jgi:hypothetical protein